MLHKLNLLVTRNGKSHYTYAPNQELQIRQFASPSLPDVEVMIPILEIRSLRLREVECFA